MLKRILLFISASFICFCNYGQVKQLAESDSFDEPEKGSVKLLQMKNGNTCYIYRNDEKLIIQVYNPVHRKIAESDRTPAIGLEKAGIENVFEINGDLLMFLSKTEDKVPKLYRVVMDGKTAAIKSEKQVAELSKLERGFGYAAAFGSMDLPSFNIVNDLYSNNYAIAIFNTLQADRGKRIEVIIFDSTHAETARAFYSSPNDVYKYMRYVDMTFAGPDRVVVLANGYNTKKSGGKASSVYAASLVKGSDKLTLTNLRFTGDLYLEYGIAKYNPVTKKVIMIPALQEGENTGVYSMKFTPYLVIFDPAIPSVEKYKPITTPVAVEEKSVELFGKKEKFNGMPADLYINNDGSVTVVSESISYWVPDRGYTSTILGNICVTRFSTEGKELKSQFIAKSQWVNNNFLSPFYFSDRNRRMQAMNSGNQYKSFSYLNGPSKSYVFFNDIKENEEHVQRGKITNIKGVGECDAFYYSVTDKDLMPGRDYVFGENTSKKEHQLALFSVSDYDPQRNIYVTLKLDKDRKDNQVKIVWMQP